MLSNQDSRIAGTYVHICFIKCCIWKQWPCQKKMFSSNYLEYIKLYIGNNVVSLTKSHANIYKHIVNLVNEFLATLIIPQYSKQDRTMKIICMASEIPSVWLIKLSIFKPLISFHISHPKWMSLSVSPQSK